MADSFDRYETGQACRETYLQHLGELLRHSGIVSEAGIAAISEGAGKYYDEMLVSQRSSGFAEEADGLTSSRLTLLCDDDLELGLRLDALSHDLFERTAGDLWRLHLRFVTLIGRADLPKTDNPVGPKGISEGLFAMFRAAGADSLDRKLDLLDRLQPLLTDRLPALYALLDEKLAAAGVVAAAPTIVSTPENAPPPARNDAPPVQRPTMPGFERVDSVPGAVPVLISPAALDRLLFRLDQLERGQANPHDPLLGSSPDLRALLPGLFADAPEPSPSPAPLTAEGLGVPDQSPEGQAIDSVDRLFRHLENDTLIPPRRPAPAGRAADSADQAGDPRQHAVQPAAPSRTATARSAGAAAPGTGRQYRSGTISLAPDTADHPPAARAIFRAGPAIHAGHRRSGGIDRRAASRPGGAGHGLLATVRTTRSSRPGRRRDSAPVRPARCR